MKEDFLHYLWKHKLFFTSNLKTTKDELISISSVGNHNNNSGPDFFNAQLRIGEQLWAGNVEIHLKSSDWYLHNHETDANYDNVILHVVWEHNIEIHNNMNSVIPTLELKSFVSKELINNYQKLFSKPQKWINCENDINSVDSFVIENWLERLYFERLERKSVFVTDLLVQTNYDWEAVLFQLLARNFGLKINGDSFFEMAQNLNFAIVRKESASQQNLESLFFGQLGMLYNSGEDSYFNLLKSEYEYQVKKHKLNSNNRTSVQFFRLRPINFPTIRISQLSSLYSLHQNLFSKCIEKQTLEEYYDLFSVSTSDFWKTHYTFEKESPKKVKKLSKAFIDLLLINTILPLKFVYQKHIGKFEETDILNLIKEIKPEKNNIIDKFNLLKIKSDSAFKTQALLELKNENCALQKCLQCAIGNSLLKG
jgi:hypothetical protein